MATPQIFDPAKGPITVTVYGKDSAGNRTGVIDPSLVNLSVSNPTGEPVTLAGNVITPGDTSDPATFEVDAVLASSVGTATPVTGSVEGGFSGDPVSLEVDLSQSAT